MSLSETLCDEVVDGIRHRAYKMQVNGVDPETQESYEFEALLLMIEMPMANGRIWSQRISAHTSLWDDKPMLETAWRMLADEATINIQDEAAKDAKADDTS
jgi:hypothetical protein